MIKQLIFISLAAAHAVFATAEKDHQCTLYMAPTSTQDEFDSDDTFIKLSMYAGIDIEPNTTIGIPEIAIPVVDINLHNGYFKDEVDADYFHQQIDFSWTAETVHANYDVFPFKEDDSGSDLNILIPGVGALGNQHYTSFVNADLAHETVLNRIPTSDDDEKVPPTEGANTKYYDVTLKSTRSIPQGMEILVGNLGVEQSSEYPLEQSDFMDVDKTLSKIQTFFDKHGDSESMTDEKKQKVYRYLVDKAFQLGHARSSSEGAEINDEEEEDDEDNYEEIMEELIDLFPDDVSSIKDFLDEGGSFVHKFPYEKKSQDWLDEHGQCLDGLYSGKSTIPGAEKGAFAARAFKEGDFISPAPLLMMPDAQYFNMYPLEFKGEGVHKYAERMEPKGEPNTQQLLLNYCFGHPESSILLFPYGMGVNMINHKSGEGANAKVIWTEASYHDPDLLYESIDDLEELDATLPLGMDIVATTDIAAGEEIFLDYGDEWQQAWEDHVQGWDSSQPRVKDALEFNTIQGANPFYTLAERDKIVEEGADDPVPENLMNACHVVAYSIEESEVEDDGVMYRFNEKETTLAGDHWRVCEIMDREDVRVDNQDTFLYTVNVYDSTNDFKADLVSKVPHKFIRFADGPYSHSSIHGQGAFRHYISIPDDIFPDSWRDLVDEE